MPELSYSSIGNDIKVVVSLEDMPGRQKANLFRQLLEESGILTKPRKAETEQYLQEIISNLWNQEDKKA